MKSDRWPDLEALIFDVDGTLAETEDAHRHAFNDAFAEAGVNWLWSRDLYRELLKVTGGKERITHYITAVLDRADAVPAAGLAELVRRIHVRKTELYASRVASGAVALRPGIEGLIREARRRGVALGIATTTSRPNVDALIEATLGARATSWFAAIACGDMVATKKPAPDVYEFALARLGVSPSRALAIEDSWNGVRSARAAGLAVIAIPSLYSAGDDFSEALMETSPESIAAVLGWTSA